MGYMEDYEDYITTKPVSYEVYQSRIAEKDSEIEKLQNKVDELEHQLEIYKQTLEIFKNEVKRYEIIQKKSKK